jgi:hypothetical protein
MTLIPDSSDETPTRNVYMSPITRDARRAVGICIFGRSGIKNLFGNVEILLFPKDNGM